MRPTLWLALMSLCVVSFFVRQASSVAADREERREQVKRIDTIKRPEAPAVFDAKIEGFGLTEDDARDRVVENACDRVARFLSDQGETEYRPSAKRLRDLRIVPPTNDLIEVEDVTLFNLGPTKQATLTLKVLPEQLKTMHSEARQQRVTQRQHWMGLSLASMVALLLVAIGVLRLEEALKGYYSYVLLFSALSVLSVIGILIWYVRASWPGM
jgi:hypothetical protein